MPLPELGPVGFGLIGLDIIAPVGYSTWWLVLAAVLVVVAVGWCVLAVVRTRAARPGRATAPPPTDLRADYLTRIDDVRRRVRTGELTPRAGHQELSVVVRAFVQRVSGAPVETMTLAQLRDLATRSVRATAPVGPPARPTAPMTPSAPTQTAPTLADLADYVGALYVPEFAPQTVRSVDAAADRAEQLVQAWR